MARSPKGVDRDPLKSGPQARERLHREENEKVDLPDLDEVGQEGAEQVQGERSNAGQAALAAAARAQKEKDKDKEDADAATPEVERRRFSTADEPEGEGRTPVAPPLPEPAARTPGGKAAGAWSTIPALPSLALAPAPARAQAWLPERGARRPATLPPPQRGWALPPPFLARA
jgi:hypothetical protein